MKTKQGGRTKGTPNLITADVRRLLADAISEHLISDLNALQPLKRAELLVKVLPYVIPPLTPKNEPTQNDVEPLTLVLTRETCSRCDGIK